MEQYKIKNRESQVIIYKGFTAHKTILDRTIVLKLIKENEFITHLIWDENTYKNILFIRKYVDNMLSN